MAIDLELLKEHLHVHCNQYQHNAIPYGIPKETQQQGVIYGAIVKNNEETK